MTELNVYNKLYGTSLMTTPKLEIDSMNVSAKIKEAFTAKAE
jgi:hypothetical protein